MNKKQENVGMTTFKKVLMLGAAFCLAGCTNTPSPLQGRRYASKCAMALWGQGRCGVGKIQETRPKGTVFTVTGNRDGQPCGIVEGEKDLVTLPNLPTSGENGEWISLSR